MGKTAAPKAPLFIVNLKSNLSIDDVVGFLNKMTDNGERVFKNFYAALPYNHLKEASSQFAKSEITFGSGYLNSIDKGSFTETIAVKMLKEIGAQFVLIGAKEEREFFGLDDEAIHAKLKKSLQEELQPILCIGETAEEFRERKSEAVLAEHLKTVLKDVDFKQLIVVYQMPLEVLADYLPSLEELEQAFQICQKAAKQAVPDLADKLVWTINAPIDLAGFSQIVANAPFEGFFFTKSGVFPHLIHEEAKELFHIHLLQK